MNKLVVTFYKQWEMVPPAVYMTIGPNGSESYNPPVHRDVCTYATVLRRDGKLFIIDSSMPIHGRFRLLRDILAMGNNVVTKEAQIAHLEENGFRSFRSFHENLVARKYFDELYEIYQGKGGDGFLYLLTCNDMGIEPRFSE